MTAIIITSIICVTLIVLSLIREISGAKAKKDAKEVINEMFGYRDTDTEGKRG